MIAALAVTAAFGTAAFDAEPVESVAETETAVQAALAEESTDYVLDANGGEIELTFGLQAIPQVNVGTTEAAYEISDDGEYGYVTVTGKGYAGIVTVTAGEETKTVHLYGGSKSKPGLNIYTGTTEALNIGDLEGTELIKDGKLALSNMGNRPVVQKDGKLGADFSDGGNIINTTDFGTERPLGISLDYQGTSTWASVINNGGTTYWNYKKWRPQATTDANWVSVSNKSEGGKCAQALIDSGDTNEEYRTIVEQAGKEA